MINERQLKLELALEPGNAHNFKLETRNLRLHHGFRQ